MNIVGTNQNVSFTEKISISIAINLYVNIELHLDKRLNEVD